MVAYKSLREFIAKLEADGELVRVKTEVSTHLEMTEIQTRLLRDKGPAVLFENVVMANGESRPCRFWSICSARSSASPWA